MDRNLIDKTYALAGLYHALNLTIELANKGSCDLEFFENSLETLLITDPATSLDIYANKNYLKTGLEILHKNLSGGLKNNIIFMRYANSLLGFVDSFLNQKATFKITQERISQIKNQLEHNSGFNDKSIENLASIYSDLIRPLGKPIHVVGQTNYLKNTLIQAKIRSLLLSAFRSSLLYKQLGGNKFTLVVSQKKLLDATTYILRDF